MCAADKTGAKIVEDWICPSSSPTSRRPHDDDPRAGAGAPRTNDRPASSSLADTGGPSSGVNHEARSHAAGTDVGVDGTLLIGAYVGGTLAILFTLLAVTAVVSYYVAARS